MSRRGPSSTQVWIESVPVSLAPGQTKVAILSTGTKAQAGHRMTLVLKYKDQALVGGRFQIPSPPKATPALVQAPAKAK